MQLSLLTRNCYTVYGDKTHVRNCMDHVFIRYEKQYEAAFANGR